MRQGKVQGIFVCALRLGGANLADLAALKLKKPVAHHKRLCDLHASHWWFGTMGPQSDRIITRRDQQAAPYSRRCGWQLWGLGRVSYSACPSGND